MPINIIGLLNLSIEKEEYIINEYISLVTRAYFEKNKISMPADIRFYKTFIISTAEIKPEFNIDKISDSKREQVPVFFLWTMSLFLSDFDIVYSEWFMGENYETLRETIKLCSRNKSVTNDLSGKWINSFKIDNIATIIDDNNVHEIINLYNKILLLYKEQIKTPDNVNLHWIYAFTKFQECCKNPFSRQCVVHVTSALEFLLVNTSGDSGYRAAFSSALICENTFEERKTMFEFLKWAFSVRERISTSLSFSSRNLIDKSDLPENMFKLRAILAKVLISTMELTNREIHENIDEMIFKGPGLVKQKAEKKQKA